MAPGLSLQEDTPELTRMTSSLQCIARKEPHPRVTIKAHSAAPLLPHPYGALSFYRHRGACQYAYLCKRSRGQYISNKLGQARGAVPAGGRRERVLYGKCIALWGL